MTAARRREVCHPRAGGDPYSRAHQLKEQDYQLLNLWLWTPAFAGVTLFFLRRFCCWFGFGNSVLCELGLARISEVTYLYIQFDFGSVGEGL